MIQEYCFVKSEALVEQFPEDRQLASPKIERKIIHDNCLQHLSIPYLEVKQEDFLERVAFLNNIRYVFLVCVYLFLFVIGLFLFLSSEIVYHKLLVNSVI